MSIKVDWTADPAKIRAAGRIPDIFTARDYGVLALIFTLVLTIGLIVAVVY